MQKLKTEELMEIDGGLVILGATVSTGLILKAFGGGVAIGSSTAIAYKSTQGGSDYCE